MKNKFSPALLAAGLLIPLSSTAHAQGPDFQDGRPPREGFNRRDGERDGRRGPGRRSAKMHLTRTWRAIDDLEKSKTPLSKAQAKQVVALVLPWSKKATMSQNDAQKLDDKLEAVLTKVQKASIDDGPFRGPEGGRGFRGDRPDGPPRDGDGRDGGPRGGREGRFDGPPRPGFGRDGEGRGPGGPGGPRFGDMDDKTRQQMRSWMESYNPFYAPTGNSNWKKLPTEIQKDTARRYKEHRATLETLSRKSKS